MFISGKDLSLCHRAHSKQTYFSISFWNTFHILEMAAIFSVRFSTLIRISASQHFSLWAPRSPVLHGSECYEIYYPKQTSRNFILTLFIGTFSFWQNTTSSIPSGIYFSQQLGILLLAFLKPMPECTGLLHASFFNLVHRSTSTDFLIPH